MLDDIRERLEEEAAALLHELNVVLPQEIERAVALGDLRENSEYSAALERQRFVQAQLQYLSRRLSEIMELDLEDIPDDRVGFGSHVTVRDVSSEEVERFILAFGDDLDFDNSEISMRSPIGRALLNRKPGDVVQVSLPAGSVQFEVLEVVTVHQILEDGADGQGDGEEGGQGDGEEGTKRTADDGSAGAEAGAEQGEKATG